MFDSFSGDSAAYIILILALVVGGGIAIIGGLSPSQNAPVTNVTPVDVNPGNVNTGTTDAKDNLQLETFGTTPAPTQKVVELLPTPSNPQTCGVAGNVISTGTDSNGNCCVEDGAVTNASECCPGVPTCQYIQEHRDIYGDSYQCAVSTPSLWCDAKPVIYLYPEKKTDVNVTLTVPGNIVASIPKYPAAGWKDITAYPDGKLTYQGKNYSELFYEASITPIAPPTAGFVIPVKDLKTKLALITTQLGLNKNEQAEFISYWLPRLEKLHAPYIFVSLFDPETKNTIDHVVITPQPDTFIQYIFYFKPLSRPVTVQQLTLPNIPKRRGFTAVEWGGIIDQGQSLKLQ